MYWNRVATINIRTLNVGTNVIAVYNRNGDTTSTFFDLQLAVVWSAQVAANELVSCCRNSWLCFCF